MSGMIIWGHHVEYKNSKSPTKPKTFISHHCLPLFVECCLFTLCWLFLFKDNISMYFKGPYLVGVGKISEPST